MKRRIQIDVAEADYELVRKCKDKLEASSFREVICRAIKLLDRCLKEDLYVREEDGEIRKLLIF